jgi:hypothetical protein
MIVKRLNTELYHHGIKGQKWGVRRYQNSDGSLTPSGKRRYNRLAKKDAKEYARAKMFYGEGAGNRRKLIKATVDERSKNEYYKQQFERHLASQDMSKHAKAAKRERKAKDAKETTAKTARGFKNLLLKTGAPVTVSALVVYGGYQYFQSHPQILNNVVKNVKSARAVKRGRKIVETLL